MQRVNKRVRWVWNLLSLLCESLHSLLVCWLGKRHHTAHVICSSLDTEATGSKFQFCPLKSCNWVQALNSLLLTGWTIYFFHRVHMVIVQRIHWYKWEHSSFSFVIKVINSFYPLGILYCHNSTTSVDLDSFNCSHLACLIKTCLKVNMYVLCFTILDNISNTHSTNHIKER